MRIYLDVSCLNRAFDDQWQERIRIESEAITLILERCASGEWRHVSSAMARVEIAANPNRDKRRKVRALLPDSVDIIVLNEMIYRRAKIIGELGFNMADAVHVAAAEAQDADVLLTCDDKLLRTAQRYSRRLAVKVGNPVNWLREQQNAKNT